MIILTQRRSGFPSCHSTALFHVARHIRCGREIVMFLAWHFLPTRRRRGVERGVEVWGYQEGVTPSIKRGVLGGAESGLKRPLSSMGHELIEAQKLAMRFLFGRKHAFFGQPLGFEFEGIQPRSNVNRTSSLVSPDFAARLPPIPSCTRF